MGIVWDSLGMGWGRRGEGGVLPWGLWASHDGALDGEDEYCDPRTTIAYLWYSVLLRDLNTANAERRL
jgi:hypothetical protein